MPVGKLWRMAVYITASVRPPPPCPGVAAHDIERGCTGVWDGLKTLAPACMPPNSQIAKMYAQGSDVLFVAATPAVVVQHVVFQ